MVFCIMCIKRIFQPVFFVNLYIYIILLYFCFYWLPLQAPYKTGDTVVLISPYLMYLSMQSLNEQNVKRSSSTPETDVGGVLL